MGGRGGRLLGGGEDEAQKKEAETGIAEKQGGEEEPAPNTPYPQLFLQPLPSTMEETESGGVKTHGPGSELNFQEIMG